jgi:DNA mismatch endonuclease (patch repair protein)
VNGATARRRLADAAKRGYDLPPPARSLNMAAVKRSDTKAELAIRQALHAMGYRFRKDYPLSLGGKLIRPDIAFTKRRVAIFVDGCYWHSCPIHGQVPATNSAFWREKLSSTTERDRMQDQLLRHAGWQVLRIWEHEESQAAVAAIIAVLKQEEGGLGEPPGSGR